MNISEIDGHTPWLVCEPLSDPMQRAVRDVMVDWYKVFGFNPTVLTAFPEDWEGTLIVFGLRDTWPELFPLRPLPGTESFELRLHRLSSSQAVIVAGGDDVRGSLYAAYSFSEKVLGVDPLYYWTDNEPIRRKVVTINDDFDYSSGPPTFKYRGWFINDEDLLSERHHDPLEENVFSLEMFDKIYETLLRLKGNLIIPGTFTLPDEKCRVLAKKRGLFLHDHHVTPLGLTTFDWPKGLKYSYQENPEVFEDFWETCVEAQKDKDLVWTVSFRGKNDCPFWAGDRTAPTSDEGRAAIINAAIAKQVDCVRKVQPTADIVFNMYAELADLYKKGLLQVPDGVICVWPNDGAGVIVNDDGFLRAGHGVYYHVIGAARNRFTEGVSPERIFSELGRYVTKKATSMCLLNVANIRNVVLGCDTAMRFLWDSEPYMKSSPEVASEEVLLEWSSRHFGTDLSANIASLYASFYKTTNMRLPEEAKPPSDAYALDRGRSPLWASTFNQVLPDFRLHRLLQLLAKKLLSVLGESNEDFSREWLDAVDDFKSVLMEPESDLSQMSENAHRYKEQVPVRRQTFYQAHILTPIDFLNHSNDALRSFIQAVFELVDEDNMSATASVRRSLEHLEQAMESIHACETGKWSAWYRSERFTCVWHSHALVIATLRSLDGEKALFAREFLSWGLWNEIYDYHQKVKENYPLFYGDSSDGTDA